MKLFGLFSLLYGFDLRRLERNNGRGPLLCGELGGTLVDKRSSQGRIQVQLCANPSGFACNENLTNDFYAHIFQR